MDDSRKRKATQAPNTSSKKHKTNTATTSRVALDTPTRPATRSVSKIQAASPAKVHSTYYRDPSPGTCQSTADTHRTRSKTGFLKSKEGPGEDRPLSSTSGLSQWVAETQHQKLRYSTSAQSSPKPSHIKKRSKAPPKPPPKPEEIIVISSDDDENPRPRKRLRRRHTTQVTEIIDLTKDEIPPPPRSRPARLRPAPLPTPKILASLGTSTSSSSPSKYLDLRRLSSSKSKPKTTPPKSHSQTQTSSWPLETKLPATPPSTKMRRQHLNDKLDGKEERNSFASKLPAVEVVINKRNGSPTAIPRVRFNSNLTQKTEPEPVHGRLVLSKELRVRLQDEEEEEENETSPLFPLNSTDGITNAVSGEGNMDASLTELVIKTEDIEDTYVDHQSSILAEDEDLVVVKEEPQFDELRSIADQISPLIDGQEQDDMEEAIFQSMLVESVNETGVPLADREGRIEEQDGYLTVPTLLPPASVGNASTVTDPAQREIRAAFEEVKEKGEEESHEGVVESKDSDAEKMPDEVVPKRPLCASTDTPTPTLDIHPYVDYEIEQQERADLEEALSQSQLAIVYSPPVSSWEDEGKSGIEDQERELDHQIDVAAPSAPDPTGNLNPYDNMSVTGDPDDVALKTNETPTLPVSVTTTSVGDKIIRQAPSNGITKTKDDEAVASSVSTEFSVPLHQVDAPCPFECSVPTTTFARFVPTESTSNVFMAGQLTQRFFAHSCLPPKVRTGAIKPAEEEREFVMEVQMTDPIVDLPAEEGQNEKMLVEMLSQGEMEHVQSVVRSEHEESVEVQVEEPVEEVPVWSETDDMQMPALLDVDVLDVMKSEAEMGAVEQEADTECEEGNEDEDGDKEAVFLPSSADIDDNAEIAVSPVLDSEVLACPALKPSDDEDIGAGVVREIQDMLTIPAVAIRDDTVLLQASEDDVVSDVAQEDEVTRVETTSVSSPQTVEAIDMVKVTPQPEFEPPSDQSTAKMKAMTTETLEKDPILSQASRSSRVLIEIIQSVINKAEPDSEVGPAAVQLDRVDGGIVYSPCFQASIQASEAPPPLGDCDVPFFSGDVSQFPPNSTSESLVQLKDTDDDTSRRSADVSPSSLQVSEELTPEPLLEDSGASPKYHVVLASSRAQMSTPEPCTQEIKDVVFASKETLEAIQSPRPHMSIPVFLAQSEGEGVAHNRPLELSSSPGLKTSPLEPPTLVDELGEDNVIAGPLEHTSKDELPRPLTFIHNSPFQNHHHLPVVDGGQFRLQSIVSTEHIPSPTAPQRRTMSNTGSESSLATLDDSPPPSTPPQSAFEAYYIRSTSPDDGFSLDIFSKLTYISFPQPQSDEEDDEYLLSLELSYPDFDIAR